MPSRSRAPERRKLAVDQRDIEEVLGSRSGGLAEVDRLDDLEIACVGEEFRDAPADDSETVRDEDADGPHDTSSHAPSLAGATGFRVVR